MEEKTDLDASEATKPIIEIIKENEKWWELPPRLSVKFNDQIEPKILKKPKTFDVIVRDIELKEFINRSPQESNYLGSSVRQNYLSGTGYVNPFIKLNGIKLLGAKLGYRWVDVIIEHDDTKLNEYELREEIKKKGKDFSGYDGSNLEGYSFDDGKICLRIIFRDYSKFNNLFTRVDSGKVSSLRISFENPYQIPGLYTGGPSSNGESFFLLDEESEISNLSKEELDELPNPHHPESYKYQLTTHDSYKGPVFTNFYIEMNPDTGDLKFAYEETYGREATDEKNEIQLIHDSLEKQTNLLKETFSYIVMGIVMLIILSVLNVFFN